MTNGETHNRDLRPQFTIRFLIWLLCVVAIGLSAYNRWIAKDYKTRAIDAEMVAEDDGVKILRVWVSYYGTLPPQFDGDGNVDVHYCRPYVDFTDPSVRADDIMRLVPYLQELLPDEGKLRVGLFVSLLRDELPRCEMFDRAIAPGFFRHSKP